MSAATMLPPKLPPPNSSILATNSTSQSRATVTLENTVCDGIGAGGHLGNFDDSNLASNLTDESMMMLSQSVDSLQTLETGSGLDQSEHKVRTIFVSGLPLDTKPRELYLLFRGFKGYISSTLKPAGKNGKLTAPVGFVTFESREQAEDVMSNLQGVKFDPEGEQHMRLEFARTNTKVTKPKAIGQQTATLGNIIAGVRSCPTGVQASNHALHGATALTQQHAAFNAAAAAAAASLVACSLPGVAGGLPPSIFNHLTGTGVEVSPALFTSPDAATAVHWSQLQGNPQLLSGYENATGYLPSTAGMLQANGFRTLISNPMGSIPSTSPHPSIQLVQAAIAQANAAAAFGASVGTTSASGLNVHPATLLSMSPQYQQAQLSPNAMTTGSQCAGGSTSPTATGSNQTVQGQPQCNQQLASLQQTLGFTNFNQLQTAAAAAAVGGGGGTNVTNGTVFPPHVASAAAAIGALGGYNWLAKELTGTDGQLQTALPHNYQSNQLNF